MNNWYESWFDSPYYHILYRDRNEDEAHLFLNHLVEVLNPSKHHLFLDVACGKGRHATTLHQKGFHVEGIDLSQNSIDFANQNSNSNLHFKVHDMRDVYKENHFDYVLNLFTSFGYFDTYSEHETAISAMTKNLKKGGKLIIDFMNSEKIIAELVTEEIKQIDSIQFHIKRTFKEQTIIKEINFQHHGQHHHFTEKVHAFTYHDFMRFFQNNGMKILNLWGDYSLNEFNDKQSPRLIILTQKWI